MNHRVVVTGIGLVTPCGIGTEQTWDALVAGRTGIGPITLFDASALETRFAGEVRDFDPLDFMDRKQRRRVDRSQQFAMAAAEMAVNDAEYSLDPAEAERSAVIVGSAIGGLAQAESDCEKVLEKGVGVLSPFFILKVLPNMAPAQIAIRFGFKGPNWSTNSACATSAHAIGEAMRLIQRGEAVTVLAGGAEAPLSVLGVAGFNAIRALSTRNDDPTSASRPFDKDRDGFVLSEGAAILLLESEEHALGRGAPIRGELVGYGASADAHHLTSPAPDHEGGQRAMSGALAEASLSPSDVDYINAHATSTEIGDLMEIQAVKALFGDHAYRIPVSSTKSMTGHLTGACGAAEAAFSLLAMDRGLVPPTINLDCPEEGIDLDCVPHRARPAELDVVLSNSFGFGGTNVSLAMRRYQE